MRLYGKMIKWWITQTVEVCDVKIGINSKRVHVHNDIYVPEAKIIYWPLSKVT